LGVDISFIILSFNSDTYLKNCFDSIIIKCKVEKLSFEIVVIDNGSKDASHNIIKNYTEEYPCIFKFILLNKNMGTTYPRNLGFKKSKGRIVCILDSDTQLMNGTLVDIFDILNNDKKIGLVAPKLLLSNNSIQNSVKKFPVFINKLKKILNIFFNLKMQHDDFYVDFNFNEIKYVDTAISACWFFRREVFVNVGMLDENIFYSPEDLDYCMRLKKFDYKIVYYPYFLIRHDTQQISHKKPFSILSLKHFFGLIYYYRKHGGWFVR
jgi:GT2 family glycosyltransferase